MISSPPASLELRRYRDLSDLHIKKCQKNWKFEISFHTKSSKAQSVLQFFGWDVHYVPFIS